MSRLAVITPPYNDNSEVHNVLSDLFFNHEHAFKKLGMEDRHTVYEAAQEFLDDYSLILACDLPSAQELTEDYFLRHEAF